MARLVIKLPRDRDRCGTLTLNDARGRRVCGPFAVAGRSSDFLAAANGNPGRNPLLRFGDTPTGISIRPSWQLSFESCQALIGRVKAAGGDAQMLNPPDRGIRGNSHMIMQDKNHLQIADLILQWLDDKVKTSPRAKK